MIKKKLKNFDIDSIAESGQCFRILKLNKDFFSFIVGEKYFEIKKINYDNYIISSTNEEWDSYLSNYFDMETDYEKIKSIALKNDNFLKKCIEYGKDIRILNQDKFEMLISFIISQRKSVPAIRTSIERLCKACSKKHIVLSEFNNKKIEYYPFPKALDILNISSQKLDSCGLGYRKDYILGACRDIVDGKIDLELLSKYDDNELLESLMLIRGVGIKVASCIALFAYHRFSVLPVDVWIKRVIEQKYNGKIPTKYKEYIGVIQQYWFNYARLKKIMN